MRVTVIWVSVFWSALTFSAHADEQPLRWVRSLDDAKRIAASEHKDLFVNFTGLEWCGHCIELDNGVLSRKEFRAAADSFVLVDLDFPSDRDQLGAFKDLYAAWTKQYMVHGYPTVVLMDETGKPYSYFTGYDRADDVTKFMDQLASARRIREARDRELAAARKAAGEARAQKLHAAIQTVAIALGSIEDREDDPVLTLYKDEVDEICQLDSDNALSLRAIYDARRRKRDEYRRKEEILAELNRFTTKEDSPAAIAYIDEQLENVTDETLRFSLKRRRYGILEWTERYEEALVALGQLLQDPSCPTDDRNSLRVKQAILLKRLGRLDEAIPFFDEQITAAAADPGARAYFLNWKANLLFGTGRHDETIATCRALRATEAPKSIGWAEATFYLAIALQKAGRYGEAISIYEEELAYDREYGGNGARPLLAIARCQHALGHADDVRRTLDDVERAIPTKVDRPAKQKEIDELRDELQKARNELKDRD